MAKKAACKCKATECEECPEWIFTFADLVMLMMGFFVILWVLKPPAGADGTPGAALPKDVVTAIREAFGDTPPDPDAPADPDIIKKLEALPMLKNPGDGNVANKDNRGLQGVDTETTSVRKGLDSVTGAPILFDQGAYTITPDTAKQLDAITHIILGKTVIIYVKGHTSQDDVPDFDNDKDGAKKASAQMDLSLKRAQAVRDYLVNQGVFPDVLRIEGCSTFEPVKEQAYTRDLQSLNRRVEVLATDTLVTALQDKPKPAPQSIEPASDPSTDPAN